MLHLRNRTTVTEESEHVVGIFVVDFVVFVPRSLEVLQMVQQAAWPNVNAAVDRTIFIPRLAIFEPDAVLFTCESVPLKLLGRVRR